MNIFIYSKSCNLKLLRNGTKKYTITCSWKINRKFKNFIKLVERTVAWTFYSKMEDSKRPPLYNEIDYLAH